MKIGELFAYGMGAIIGVLLGIAGFLKLYLPLKGWLGLDHLVSGDMVGEGSIVPMETFLPLYAIAGNAIDIIVLIAFIIAGVYGFIGIMQALRKKS